VFLDTDVGLFLPGFLGGLAADVLLLYKSREDFKGLGVAAFFRRGRENFGYLLITVLMCALGGALVLLYEHSGAKVVPILALQIGASTPLIITKFASAAPDPLRADHPP
jgi:hypothetical protein